MKIRNAGSSSQADNRLNSQLGDGLVLSGEVSFSGGLQVDGHVKGTLKAKNDDQAGRLIVGKKGQIDGNIDAPNIMIEGTVKGNVCCNNSIILGSTAVIDGDISYQTLEISLGANVNGKLLRLEKERGAAVSNTSPQSSR